MHYCSAYKNRVDAAIEATASSNSFPQTKKASRAKMAELVPKAYQKPAFGIPLLAGLPDGHPEPKESLRSGAESDKAPLVQRRPPNKTSPLPIVQARNPTQSTSHRNKEVRVG